MHKKFLLVAVTAAVAAGVPAQVTVTVSADKDNTLYEDLTGSLSNGAGQYLFAGLTALPEIRRALLHFDVAAVVPLGSFVASASLQLNVSRTLTATAVRIDLHRVLADWGEGASLAPLNEGMGGPAMANDATWLHTFWPGSTWTTIGGDFAPAPSASSLTPASGAAVWSAGTLAADVQRFVERPTQNFGWLLKTDEQFVAEVRRFDSRDNLIPANQPVLTITYLPAASVRVVGAGCPGSNGTFTLAHSGVPAHSSGFTVLHLNGVPGTLAGNAIGLGYPGAGLPVYPGCNVYLNLGLPRVTHNLLFLDGTGSSATPIPIPVNLQGLPLGFQAFALDPGAPGGFVLSNALGVVLG